MRLSKVNALTTTLTVATIFGLLSVNKPAAAANLTGLTPTNTLVNFNSDNPSVTTSVGVTGLGDGNLLGIDYRPANGLLYGLTDTDGIYTINTDTGEASLVSTLSTSFDGGFQSGLDFNPVVDRLRVVGSNDQNFRVNVDTGATIVDTPLAFAAFDVANFGVDPNISGAAYTNSFAGPPDPSRTTALVDIDYDLDIFAPQLSPNDGTLVTGGAGGLNLPPLLGFDIFSTANGDNIVFIASNSRLFSVNLDRIDAGDTIVRIGSSNSNTSFVGLAAEPIPEPSAVVGTLALGALGTLSMLKRKQLKRNQKQNVKA